MPNLYITGLIFAPLLLTLATASASVSNLCNTSLLFTGSSALDVPTSIPDQNLISVVRPSLPSSQGSGNVVQGMEVQIGAAVALAGLAGLFAWLL